MHQADDLHTLIRHLLELGAELDQQRATVARAIATAERLAIPGDEHDGRPVSAPPLRRRAAGASRN